MNNTDKLLRAFISASGYTVEESVDYDEQEIPPELTESLIGRCPSGADKYILKQRSGSYEINDNGNYLQVLQYPDIDYKVTKKNGDLFSLGCQVANDDIKVKLDTMGFELDKNQMHDLMETIIFHIAR